MGKPSKLEEVKRRRLLLLFLILVYELQCSKCLGKLQQDLLIPKRRCWCKGQAEESQRVYEQQNCSRSHKMIEMEDSRKS